MSHVHRKRKHDHVGGNGHATLPAPKDQTRPGALAGVNWPVTAVCALLVGSVVLVFGQSTRFDFVNFDDDQYVYDNSHITGGVTRDGLSWVMTHHHVGNWHPLTSLSHMLDCQWFGLNPRYHHGTNLVLHALATVMLFLTLRRMTDRLWGSAVVAALFAIHPLRVESVVWISERKDVLSGLFFALTLWAYQRYARRAFSIWRYLLVFLFLALGLMCKPMLVTVPLLLLVVDYWPLRRWGGESGMTDHRSGVLRIMLEKIPLLLLSVVFVVITFKTQQITMESTESLPVKWRIANALVSYVAYLGKCVWPFDLAPFYPHPRSTLALWKIVGAGIVLAGITAAALLQRRKRPYLLAGWLWYAGMLVPVIGLVQVGRQAMADRYTYLPLIGIFFAVAWLVSDLLQTRRRGPRIAAVLGGVAIACLMLRAGDQASYWKNSVALFEHTLACNDRNATAHLNLANELAKQGAYDRAVEHYRNALQFKPDDVMIHNNLGLALIARGEFDTGISHFRRAAELAPKFAQAYYNMGLAFTTMQKPDQAAKWYRKSIEANPEFAQGYNNLGATLDAVGKSDEAIRCYHTALSLEPMYADVHFNLGNALDHKGQTNDAVREWKKTLQINPRYAAAHVQLGVVAYNRGRVAESISHLSRALEINPKLDAVRQNLQLIYRQQGLTAPSARR